MKETTAYWIPVKTVAATEKDKWLECSVCKNTVNLYDLEKIRLSNIHNDRKYEKAMDSQYRTCSRCGSEMDTEITHQLREMNIAKGDGRLQKVVQEIISHKNKKEA